MSIEIDVKNARLVLEKFGKKKPSEAKKASMLRKETNWSDEKVKSVLKIIEHEDKQNES